MLSHIFSHTSNCYFLVTPPVNPNKPYSYVLHNDIVIQVHILEAVTDLPTYLYLFNHYIENSAYDIVKYSTLSTLLPQAVECFNCSKDKVIEIIEYTVNYKYSKYNKDILLALLPRIDTSLLVSSSGSIRKYGYTHLIGHPAPTAGYITDAIKYNNIGELLYILSNRSYKHIHAYFNAQPRLTECDNIEIVKLLLPYIDKNENPIDYCIAYGLLYDEVPDIKETNYLAIALYAYHKGVILSITDNADAHLAEIINTFDIPTNTIYKFMSTLSSGIFVADYWYTEHPYIAHIIDASNILLGYYKPFTLDDCELCDSIRNKMCRI